MFRIFALALALLGSGPVTAAPDTTQQDVTAIIHDMAARWTNGTWKTIPQDLWDLSEPVPMYLAEEQPGWLVGWDAVKTYFDPQAGGPPRTFDYVASDITVRPIGKDMAVAIWTIDWQMKMGRIGPLHEKLRANAILRKTKGGWKFIHYGEAPKSPLAYMQDLYGESVTPGFRARLEDAGKRPSP